MLFRSLNIAVPDAYVEHGNVDILRKEIGIDADTVTARILEKIRKETED